MHYPGLIKNRCGVYCYRLTFPARLRLLGAPRELRLSLHTKRRDNLKARWFSAFHAATSLISELENSLLRDIDEMAEVSEKMKDSIATWRAKHQQRRQDNLRAGVDETWLDWQVEQDADQREQALELATRAAVMEELDNELQQAQARQAKATVIAHQAAKVARLERTQKENNAARLAESQRTVELLVTSRATVPLQPMPSVCDEPLATLRDRFNEHCATVEKLAAKTLKQRQSNLERFLDVVGPRSSAALGATDIRHYRDVIRALPANLTKKPIWQERPDALTLRPDWYRGLCKLGLPSLSEQGQLTHFHDTGPFLKWLSTERYVAEDFSDVLTPIKNDADYQERGQPFSQGQLNTLVVALWQADSRRPREQPKDWHFWAPLLGLTMGMRGDEIGRLCVADVVVVGNVAMLSVPGTKTDNAERLIPLPDVVLTAGFMQLVDWARGAGDDTRLFPDWVAGGGKSAKNYSASLGRWFNYEQGGGLIARLGIWSTAHQVSFHSLRHSFATCAHHADVELDQIQMIMGHGTDLAKTYGLPAPKNLGATVSYIKLSVSYSPRMQEACVSLRDAINRVDFGCDLTGLNWLDWRKAKKLEALT